MRWLLVMLMLVGRAAAGSPIHVTYDLDHLDLAAHKLQFQVSRPVQGATITAIGEDGKELGTGEEKFESSKGWLAVTWTQPADAKVMVLKLRVFAADGAATNVQLVPWSVTVDHEDVTFKSDSAVIEPEQQAKLDASLGKIQDIAKQAAPYMKLTLYVAGYTDTVGPAAKNLKLSVDRATAIGKYFAGKGLNVAVAGFGETALKVSTPDETDEVRNRRADYVLGPAGGAPPFKTKASWRALAAK